MDGYAQRRRHGNKRSHLEPDPRLLEGSRGCEHCYAMGVAYRFSGPGQPYEGLAKKVGGKAEWTNRVYCVDELLDAPLRWRKPRRIFVNSMSDLFHPDVPDNFILRVFAIMAACPHHTFQVLTKRAHRMWSLLSSPDTPIFLEAVAEDIAGEAGWCHLGRWTVTWPWPLPNVWLGVSAEDQATANERIPWLLQTPAAVRWISAEPLLGLLDLTRLSIWHSGVLNALTGIAQFDDSEPQWFPRLDWVVVGGESGHEARPMHPDWPRQIRDDCRRYNAPFFFKQWGAWQPAWGAATHLIYRDGRCVEDTHDHPDAWRHKTAQPMQRVGKKRAGRLLDGREWNEYPSRAPEAYPR